MVPKIKESAEMFLKASERKVDTIHEFEESFRNGKAFIEGKGSELNTLGGQGLGLDEELV